MRTRNFALLLLGKVLQEAGCSLGLGVGWGENVPQRTILSVK